TLQPDDGASLAAYTAWRDERDRLRATASTPAIEVFVASQAADAPPSAVAVEFVSTVTAPRTASGRRFGALVHAVLPDAPLAADTASIRRFAELTARVLGAPRAETNAACAAVESALAHPLLVRSRSAARIHREYPIASRFEDGRFLEGVIDL